MRNVSTRDRKTLSRIKPPMVREMIFPVIAQFTRAFCVAMIAHITSGASPIGGISYYPGITGPPYGIIIKPTIKRVGRFAVCVCTLPYVSLVRGVRVGVMERVRTERVPTGNSTN